MKVIFKYSLKKEQEQVDWFEKNYSKEPIAFILPKGKVKPISQKNLQKNLTKIESEWNKIEKEFFEVIKKNELQSENSYICYLSRYGSSGFYELPNKLIIRIANRQDLSESNINIAHELAHLILHKNKKDLNLEFIDKERMVDDFLAQREFKKILPEYKKQKF